MGIKGNYQVKSIPKHQTHNWLLHKHYAHRIPGNIMRTFGLYDSNKDLVGVCCYGLGGAINNNTMGEFDMLELTRLVVNDDHEKNLTSFFIGQTIKLLKTLNKPLVLISYADSTVNHNGYIYQATNWIYTGLTGNRDVFIDKQGKEWHPKSVYDTFGSSSIETGLANGFKIIKTKPKHRYFYLLGDKKAKKEMLAEIKKKYEILPYPKGENQRYDASYKPTIQKELF